MTVLNELQTKKEELSSIKESILDNIDSIIGNSEYVSKYSTTFNNEDFLQIILVVPTYLPHTIIESINSYVGENPIMYFTKQEVEIRYMYDKE